MRTLLTQGDFGTYELSPVSKKIAHQLKQGTGADSVLFQTDWDFPGLARALGWRGKIGREKCEHSSTDGTVDCRECGRTAHEFIQAAQAWLDAHCDCVFVGKGEEYFDN